MVSVQSLRAKFVPHTDPAGPLTQAVELFNLQTEQHPSSHLNVAFAFSLLPLLQGSN